MRTRERISHLERMYQALALRAQAICDLIVAEAGAVKSNARARQFDVPMKHFRHYLDTADRDPVRALAPEVTPNSSGTKTLGTAFVVREPVGVIAAITPYNYPYFLNLAKVVPALLTGNTVILKPSPYTPFQALVLATAAQDAGLPKGVFNVITGGTAVGEELTRDARVDLISFTGSDTVGSAIAAQSAPTLKRLVLELGGKSALIVRHDANLRVALAQALRGFTSHAGTGLRHEYPRPGTQFSARALRGAARPCGASREGGRSRRSRHGDGSPDTERRARPRGTLRGARTRERRETQGRAAGARPRSSAAITSSRPCSTAPIPMRRLPRTRSSAR